MCERPIYTLQQVNEHEYYLPPHSGSFGITLRGDRCNATISKLEKNSFAELAGLQAGARVRINDEDSTEASTLALRVAIFEKRMIRVSNKGYRWTQCGLCCLPLTRKCSENTCL
jgi:hypothetical protein